MVWTKLDDAFPENPKLLRAIANVGDAAGWLWVVGINYCNKHLTDGFIPREAVPRMLVGRKPYRIAAGLVDAGCWREVDGGYAVHDFLDHNNSREAVTKMREADRNRKQKSRKGEHPSDGYDANSVRNGFGVSRENSAMSRPDTERNPNGVQPESERCPSMVTTPSPLLSDPNQERSRFNPGVCVLDPGVSASATQPEPGRTHTNEIALSANEAAVLSALRRWSALADLATPEVAQSVYGGATMAGRATPAILRGIAEYGEQLGNERAAGSREVADCKALTRYMATAAQKIAREKANAERQSAKPTTALQRDNPNQPNWRQAPEAFKDQENEDLSWALPAAERQLQKSKPS